MKATANERSNTPARSAWLSLPKAGRWPKPMRGIVILYFAVCVTFDLCAQGIVNFGNDSRSRIMNALTGQAVTGNDGIQVALYAAPLGSSALSQVGSAIQVGAQVPGIFAGGPRTVTFVAPGEAVRVEARAWSVLYPTYESALYSGAWTGKSPTFQMPTGGAGSPPTPPNSLSTGGLQGFVGPSWYSFPPVVSTAVATSIMSTNITLNAWVNPNGWGTTAWFEWGPTTNYGSTTSPQSLASGYGNLPIQAQLGGLSPGTEYHFRGRAMNAAGSSAGQDRTLRWDSTQPRLKSTLQQTSGTFLLQFTGSLGQIYWVQFSTNLIEWAGLTAARDLQNGLFEYQENLRPAPMFFRVMLP